MRLSDEKINELIQLTDTIEQGFKFQNNYYQRFLAVNSLKMNSTFDVEKVKELMVFIKRNTSVFSPFRSQSFVLASLLHLHAKKPEDVFLRIKGHYDAMKQEGFKESNYLPMACYCLDSLLYDEKVQDMAIQTRSYKENLISKSLLTFKEMKNQHPWLTSGEDYSLAILIAHSNKNMERVESFYQGLSLLGLKKTNGLQSLANILALSNEEEHILMDRTLQIKEQLKSLGLKVNETMYPGLGLLSHLGEDEVYLNGVVERVNQLHDLKKFKWIDKNLLFLFAILLISEELKNDVASKTMYETTISITVEQIITAQIAVMIAIMASTTAATSST